MQRARRLTSIAAIAAVGVLALAGCRSQPGVAAYVGDQQITEEQIVKIVDDVEQKLPADSPVQPPTRAEVVRIVLVGDLCARLATDHGYQPRAEVTVEQVAQATGMPADSTYVRHWADLETCMSGVPVGELTAPTEEEFADLVVRGKDAGAVPAEISMAEARNRLDGDQLRMALAIGKVLAEAATDYDVSINPRYRPLEHPLLWFANNSVAVQVQLGEGEPGTVIDPR